jgi:hypothetical protein
MRIDSLRQSSLCGTGPTATGWMHQAMLRPNMVPAKEQAADTALSCAHPSGTPKAIRFLALRVGFIDISSTEAQAEVASARKTDTSR